MEDEFDEIVEQSNMTLTESEKIILDYTGCFNFEEIRNDQWNVSEIVVFFDSHLKSECDRDIIIKQLQDRITDLNQISLERLNKIDELEGIIDSMKCCGNCDRDTFIGCAMDCSRQECTDSTNDLWELKENDKRK